MSGWFWISTRFLPLPISKLIAMKLLALGSQINAILDLFVCTNLWVSESNMISPIAPMHVSVRHPSIIATLKVEGWKEHACIFNLDNCAAACIYGAEQKHYSPIAADGQGQSNGCLYSGRSCQRMCLGGWGHLVVARLHSTLSRFAVCVAQL